MDNKYWKNYYDDKPVVLKKSKTINTTPVKSKSNIHVKKTDDNDDDIKPIVYYNTEQIETIKNGRTILNLTQSELAKKISPSLKSDFITNIENGKTPFDKKTYNTICRTLRIKIFS